MSRPGQLLLVGVVYALGLAAALAKGAAFDATAVGAGALALASTAAAIHYANEYADYETDALTDRTAFSGGSGALEATGLDRRLPGVATLVTLVVGLAAGTGSWSFGRLPTAAFGLLLFAAVFGVGYSLPPLSLSRRGLGELDNALLGGFVLPCYGAATVGGLTGGVALAVVPFSLLVFVNLLETQWPDRAADRAAGKETLVVRWPRRRLRASYAVVSVAAFGWLLALSGGAIPWSVTLSTLPAAPLFVWGTVRFTNRERPFPAVVGMVAVAVGQLLAWGRLALG
jgi:1,4-dihydroxy-2-naphthoate octaprenyltransferase